MIGLKNESEAHTQSEVDHDVVPSEVRVEVTVSAGEERERGTLQQRHLSQGREDKRSKNTYPSVSIN